MRFLELEGYRDYVGLLYVLIGSVHVRSVLRFLRAAVDHRWNHETLQEDPREGGEGGED